MWGLQRDGMGDQTMTRLYAYGDSGPYSVYSPATEPWMLGKITFEVPDELWQEYLYVDRRKAEIEAMFGDAEWRETILRGKARRWVCVLGKETWCGLNPLDPWENRKVVPGHEGCHWKTLTLADITEDNR